MNHFPPNTRISYGYVIAACCFSVQMVGIGTHVTYGVFFNSLMAEFQWSRAAISGASSLAFFLMGLFGVLVGHLNDRYGPKNLMRVTALFFGAGLMLMYQVSSIGQLYLYYGVIFGIGLSTIDVIALTTIARWFSRNRGMMTGIVKVGTGAGQFTIPLAAGLLITAYGWRQAYLAIGSAAMIILVCIAQLLKRDPSALQTPCRFPEAPPAETPPSAGSSLNTGKAIRTIQFWIICVVNLMLVFCLMIVLVHVVPHARDMGLATAPAAAILSTIGGVSMLGRFIAGMAIDRIGSKPIMVSCFVVLIGGLLWLQVADTPWRLFFFACVYGLAHGGFFTAISPIVAEIFGMDAHGAIFGIVVCFGTTGGALGPIVAGQLFDITNSYSTAFGMITLMGVIGLLLTLLLKPIAKPTRQDR